MIGTEEEYFVFSQAKRNRFSKRRTQCLTLGIQIKPDLKESIKFLNDPKIQTKNVSQTCERCPEENCLERATPPLILEKKNNAINRKKSIQLLKNESFNEVII